MLILSSYWLNKKPLPFGIGYFSYADLAWQTLHVCVQNKGYRLIDTLKSDKKIHTYLSAYFWRLHRFSLLSRNKKIPAWTRGGMRGDFNYFVIRNVSRKHKRSGNDLLLRSLSWTTIGVFLFHVRVRNGIGWFQKAIITRSFMPFWSLF